jgi:surface polysaccharide O-acyltransferase-like enzyme
MDRSTLAATAARRYDIDALRVFAFGLLILYHVGMLYVTEWGWHVKSSYQQEWLQVPMLVLNRWRMELLFLISGLAVHFLRRGTPSRRGLVRERSLRLLLPLAFGMAVVLPIQAYCQGVTAGGIKPGFANFLPYYFTHAPNHYGLTWNHLWYLPYLWVYTLILVGSMPLLESAPGVRLRGRLASLRGLPLLFLPGLPLAVAAQLLQERFPETHELVNDWFNHAIYLTVFVYGYLIGTSPGLWQEFERLRRRSLAWAIFVGAAYLAMIRIPGDDGPAALDFGVRLCHWAYTWLALATVLGWGHHYLNRPFRWLPYATEAVFPWYILHQSLIIGLAYVLMPLQLGPWLEPALVLSGTVAGCLLLHELLIRRIGWLRPLFGVKPLKARAGRNIALTAAAVPAE